MNIADLRKELEEKINENDENKNIISSIKDMSLNYAFFKTATTALSLLPSVVMQEFSLDNFTYEDEYIKSRLASTTNVEDYGGREVLEEIAEKEYEDIESAIQMCEGLCIISNSSGKYHPIVFSL